MIGGVTRRMLPHLSGVPHLHVNRPLVLQKSVVVVQNNGKERTCAARAICFFLIRSIDLDAIFIALRV